MQTNGFKEDEGSDAVPFGTPVAFEALYRRYWFEAYCMAYKKLGSQQDAEDAVQSLFRKIWQNRQTLQVKNIGAYLAVSVNNMATDILRKRQKNKWLLDEYTPYATETSDNTAEQNIQVETLQKEIEKAISRLPSKTQTVFRLSRYEHKSVKEVAEQLQLSEKAVEYHITQSLSRIKSFLKKAVQIFFTFF